MLLLASCDVGYNPTHTVQHESLNPFIELYICKSIIIIVFMLMNKLNIFYKFYAKYSHYLL